jgi:hypothetical protein
MGTCWDTAAYLLMTDDVAIAFNDTCGRQIEALASTRRVQV